MPALSKHRWTAADVRALMDERRHWPRYELLCRPRGSSVPFLLDVRAFFDENKGLKRFI